MAQRSDGRYDVQFRLMDVVKQTRSHLFGWRGPFTPEFVVGL